MIILVGMIFGVIVFLYHGLGFLLLNTVILGLLELLGLVFSGILGFIVLAFFIKLVLVKGK